MPISTTFKVELTEYQIELLQMYAEAAIQKNDIQLRKDHGSIYASRNKALRAACDTFKRALNKRE